MSDEHVNEPTYHSTGKPFVYTCGTCGCMVIDTSTHTVWHEALDAGSRTVGELAVRSTGMRGSDRSPGHRMCKNPSCMDDTPHVAHG